MLFLNTYFRISPGISPIRAEVKVSPGIYAPIGATRKPTPSANAPTSNHHTGPSSSPAMIMGVSPKLRRRPSDTVMENILANTMERATKRLARMRSRVLKNFFFCIIKSPFNLIELPYYFRKIICLNIMQRTRHRTASNSLFVPGRHPIPGHLTHGVYSSIGTLCAPIIALKEGDFNK